MNNNKKHLGTAAGPLSGKAAELLLFNTLTNISAEYLKERCESLAYISDNALLVKAH